MPKLLLFAPCEKVIIDENTHTTSIIVLLEALNIAVPEAEKDKLPKDSVLPVSWHVYALWTREPEDEGKQFEARVTGYTEEGEVGVGSVISLDFLPNIPNFRGVINFIGMPLYPLISASKFILKLFVREKGEQNEWELTSEFPILVVHELPKPKQ